MSIIALDVGSKRIGVAVADPTGTFALPLETIARTNVASDIERIAAIARDREAAELVVGDPLTLSGERGIASSNIDAFVERLSHAFSGTIHRQDERLTTAAATKTLIGADVSRKRRKEVVDAMAAALILETFLRRRASRS